MKEQLRAYFDESFYALTKDAKKRGMEPFDHYLQIGEARGVAPSARFSPKYYVEKYPDLASVKTGLLSHYVRYGRQEGRSATPPDQGPDFPTSRIRKRLPTMLLVVHDATRSGAPFLAWNLIKRFSETYNVVTLLLAGGPIEQELNDVSAALIKVPSDMVLASDAATDFFQKILTAYSPKFAIANSAATRGVAVVIEQTGLPVISLIHEFSTDCQPLGTMHGLFRYVSKVVFPAEIVAASHKADYYMLRTRTYELLAQGATQHPQIHAAKDQPNPALQNAPKDCFTVLGLGTVTLRKGVDLFISVAAEVIRKNPSKNFRFIWAGHNYAFDKMYKEYLRQQIERSGLNGKVFLLDEVLDVRPLYRKADAFLLSSRLDPLPNVAIDAALGGKPVICFEGASGTAEILLKHEATKRLVVPYVDTAAAARVIIELEKNRRLRTRISDATRKIARTTFNLKRYVSSLDALAKQCLAEQRQLAKDLSIIKKSGAFNSSLCFGTSDNQSKDTQLISRYLKEASLARPLHQARSGLRIRRPMLGFNPLIYASDNPSLEKVKSDALAHYLLAGKPSGRWAHKVLLPSDSRHTPESQMRVAVHGHFYYPDLLEEFLARLSLNSTPIDIFLTTTGDDEAAQIQKILKKAKQKAAFVRVVPNKGRDIGPFLKLFPKIAARYDIIGHLHGKKSPHVAREIGDRWRDFMLQHLIGGKHAMADTILAQFASDPSLGLVFPEDPHLNDWDENLEMGQMLARRMKLRKPLPTHFDFPIGTMFWARPAALKPLFDLNLKWADYPAEPLPIDGTIVHALERIVPFAAEKAGFTYATTHVPGIVR